ncbi:unnamed protein product [Trifolium pratense]|uniref:Uncharacterized protein n=1 Tax=Trifolium pratense TaxID=57577 RepID=A0ACB0K5S6_TRIPR|nr:unnamed protein product [Trifolium pratense]
MQCSYDTKGNSVPTILMLMQDRLYSQGELKGTPSKEVDSAKESSKAERPSVLSKRSGQTSILHHKKPTSSVDAEIVGGSTLSSQAMLKQEVSTASSKAAALKKGDRVKFVSNFPPAISSLQNYSSRADSSMREPLICLTFIPGYFCPALAKAVKTMKKGEKVLLNIKPEYAFGESGKPSSGDDGVVPPNASLQMDLGLVSWRIVSDITKDRKVLKKILKEGEGYERPNDGALVLG